MKLNEVLEEFGFSEREAKVYLASLELGEGSIQDIAKKAGVERTGTYYLINNMVKAGLMSQVSKDGKTIFSPIKPDRLMEIAERNKRLLEEHLGQFRALFNASDKKPKVRLYEGMDGIKTVFDLTLSLKQGEEILAFTPFQVAHQFISDWGHDYVRKRARKNIFVRDIAEDSEHGREHQSKDKEELRETRLIPQDKFLFTNEINIMPDWISIVSYKEMIALVVESKDIASMMKSIFELAWLGAERFQTN